MRLLALLLVSISALAQTGGPVEVELSLVREKPVYKVGEAIEVVLTFNAQQAGFTLNETTTSPASPVDTPVVAPAKGAVRWLDDQSDGQPYSPDYMRVQELVPGKAETVALTLNEVYRFDGPGRYTLQVVTRRLVDQSALATNMVAFEIEPMTQEEEAGRAAKIEGEIRSAADLQTAQRYAEELDWLPGDAAAKVKLSLLLHPKTFYPFAVDVSKGLWIARNRDLVVTGLERALDDPVVDVSPVLALLTSLKHSVTHLPFEQLEDGYLTRVAETLTSRTGNHLTEAANTVFVRWAHREQTERKGFRLAREALIANFSSVNDYNLELLLRGYSRYFVDARVAPALRQFLARQRDPIFNGTRADALKLLTELAPQESRGALAAEICNGNRGMSETAPVDIETLPEVDQCLMEKLRSTEERMLDGPSALVARFASAVVFDDVLAQYRARFETARPITNSEARGHLLAYLLRWNPQRAMPLLESALPPGEPDFSGQLFYTLAERYSPELEVFFRRRLVEGPARQAGAAAYELSQHGPAEDRALIEDRLKKWRAAWASREVPETEGVLEGELVRASLSGKAWSAAEDQLRAAWASCVSQQCRDMGINATRP